MSRENHILALFEEANPAPDEQASERDEINYATHLATLLQRSSEMTETQIRPDNIEPEKRPPWFTVAAAALVVVLLGVTVILFNRGNTEPPVATQVTVPVTTAPDVQTSPPPPTGSQLAPAYSGVIFGDLTCCKNQWRFTLNLAGEDENLTGELVRTSPTRNPGVYAPGEISGPVLVTREDDTLRVFWDEGVGAVDDTTRNNCEYTELALTLTISDDGSRLEVVEGHITGGDLPTESEEIEFCHQGVAQLTGGLASRS